MNTVQHAWQRSVAAFVLAAALAPAPDGAIAQDSATTDRLTYSKRLAQKGFATEHQVRADELDVEQAELAKKRAEQQVFALRILEASQKSADEFQKSFANQQSRLAENPRPTKEKLEVLANELEQAKAKMLESFEAQIAAVRRAIEESQGQRSPPATSTAAPQPGAGQGPSAAKGSAPASTGQSSAAAKDAPSQKAGGGASDGPGASGGSGASRGPRAPGGPPGGSRWPLGEPGGALRGEGVSGGDMMGQSGRTTKAAPQPAPVRMRVFQLKECEPEGVGSILEKLLGAYYTNRRTGASGMSGPAGAMSGAPLGPMGMGSMGGRGDEEPWPPPSLRVAVDTRTKSLIVRGSEEQLKIVAEIIAALDSPADKPIPQGQTVRVYRLRFANATAVAQLLERLGLSSRVAGDEQANAVIVSGTKEEMEEIGELIKSLDVEDPAASPNGGAVGPRLLPAPTPTEPAPMPLSSPYRSDDTTATISPVNRNLEIRLTSDGRLTVNGKAVEQSKLAEQLAEIRKRRTITGGLGPGKDYFSPPPVSIEIDEQLPYFDLQALTSTLAKEGFVKVTFQGNKPANAVK